MLILIILSIIQSVCLASMGCIIKPEVLSLLRVDSEISHKLTPRITPNLRHLVPELADVTPNSLSVSGENGQTLRLFRFQ